MTKWERIIVGISLGTVAAGMILGVLWLSYIIYQLWTFAFIQH